MEKKKIRILVRSQNSVTIDGLSTEEVENIVAAVHNTCYVGFKDNKLETVSRFKDLPGPIDDPVMYPFWRKPKHEEISQISLFDTYIFEETSKHDSPSIYIVDVCGYYYTEEKYKLYVERLISYGFECMRSKRDNDAEFWENWYLPGLWSAKGELKKYLGHKDCNIDVALGFIRGHVEFGSLSVSTQKLAQSIPG
jgi:hypothetical protein